MEIRSDEGHLLIHMVPDEDYLECIKEACREAGFRTAVILSSIGQLKEVTLGYFRGPGDYHPQVFDGPLELVGVSGIISLVNDEYIPHLHAVLGDPEKMAVGGHLVSGKVSITNETVIGNINIGVNRKKNGETGLMDVFLG